MLMKDPISGFRLRGVGTCQVKLQSKHKTNSKVLFGRGLPVGVVVNERRVAKKFVQFHGEHSTLQVLAVKMTVKQIKDEIRKRTIEEVR